MNNHQQHAPTSARERYSGYADATVGDGRHSMLASIFALSVFIGVAALSVWQATEPSRARDQIEIGVAALTDIDTYLDENHENIQAAANEGDTVQVGLPGFPLDVALSRQEASQLDLPQMREVILDRSAGLVYAEGLSAFDRTGAQSLSFLSSEWILDRLVGLLAGSWHSRAGWVAAICAIVAALSAPFVFQRRGAAGGLRTIGFATLAGAVPGLVFSGAATYWFARNTSDDVFSATISTILEDFFLVPRQDYLIVTVTGALFAVSGYAIAFLQPRLGVVDDDEYYEFADYEYEESYGWDGDGAEPAEPAPEPRRGATAPAMRERIGDDDA